MISITYKLFPLGIKGKAGFPGFLLENVDSAMIERA
jgi:hypothetical protein